MKICLSFSLVMAALFTASGYAYCQGMPIAIRAEGNARTNFAVIFTRSHLFPRGPSTDYHFEGPQDAYGQKKPFDGICGKFYAAGADTELDSDFIGADGIPTETGNQIIEGILLKQCNACLDTMKKKTIALCEKDFQTKYAAIDDKYSYNSNSTAKGPIFKADTEKVHPTSEDDTLVCVIVPASKHGGTRSSSGSLYKFSIVSTMTVKSKKLFNDAVSAAAAGGPSLQGSNSAQSISQDYSINSVFAEKEQSRLSCRKKDSGYHY